MPEQKSSVKNGVKDLVLRALMRESPQSVRSLHRVVEKDRPGITYHAVHKAVNSLLRRNVLRKEHGNYSISREWMENIAKILEDMRSNYLTGKSSVFPGLKDFRHEGQTQTITVETMEEAENYRKRLQWEYLMMEGEKKPYCSMVRHMRSPLFASERALTIMSLATRAKSKAYILCAGSTAIDNWCADYYRNEFVKVQTGVHFGEPCETVVIGDVVLQLYLPKEILNYIGFVYSSTRNVGEMDIPEFYNTTYRLPSEVRIVITKNTEIAEHLRQQILSHFKREKLAIFDVNGTLLEEFLERMMVDYMFMHGKVEKKEYEEMNYALREEKGGRLSHDATIEKIQKVYLNAIKGMAVEELRKMAASFVQEGVMPLLPYAKKLFHRMNSHYCTVAITKSTRELAEAFGQVFPFDYAICSEAEVKGGKFTGKMSKNLLRIEEKRKAFAAFMKETGRSLDGAAGFGNAYQDMSFMDKVSMPVAIRADKKLREHAVRNDWIIFNPSDDVDALTEKLLRSFTSKGTAKTAKNVKALSQI